MTGSTDVNDYENCNVGLELLLGKKLTGDDMKCSSHFCVCKINVCLSPVPKGKLIFYIPGLLMILSAPSTVLLQIFVHRKMPFSQFRVAPTHSPRSAGCNTGRAEIHNIEFHTVT